MEPRHKRVLSTSDICRHHQQKGLPSDSDVFKVLETDISKAVEEANLFKAFTEKTKRKREESRDSKPKRPAKKNDSLEAEDWRAISEAAELLEEVKDIRDELNILKALLTDQNSVWKGLSDINSEAIGEKGPSYVLREVEEMDQTSRTIQDSVSHPFIPSMFSSAITAKPMHSSTAFSD